MNRKLVGAVAVAGIAVGAAFPAYEYVIHPLLRPHYEKTVNYLVENTPMDEDMAEQYADLGLDDLFSEKIYALPHFVEKFSPDTLKHYIANSNPNLGLNYLAFKVATDTAENPIYTGENYEYWTSAGFSFKAMDYSADFGRSLEEAIEWRKSGYTEEAYLEFARYEVPLADANRLFLSSLLNDLNLETEMGTIVPNEMQTVNNIDLIIDLYSKETGTTSRDRRSYIFYGIHDPNIKLLADNGIEPYLFDAAGGLATYNDNPDWIIELVKVGKLNGDLYKKCSIAFEDTNRQIAFALNNNYDLEESIRWASLDFDVYQMDAAKKGGISFAIAQDGRQRNLEPEQILSAFEFYDFVKEHNGKLVPQ